MSRGASERPKTKEDEALVELHRNDLSVRRRRALLLHLADVGSERSVDVLRENLYEADLKIKVGVLSALEKIASDEAVDALSEFVRKQTGPPFALAVSSLRLANPHRAMPKLLEILQERRGELSEGNKQVIIHALAHAPHRSQVPVLSATLKEGSWMTRRVAAMALSRIRAPESRVALQEAAQSLFWVGRMPIRRELNRCQHDA
jgi:HEAT repeat protein